MTTNPTFSSPLHPARLPVGGCCRPNGILVTWLVVHGQIPRWLALLPIVPYMIFFAAMVRSALKMDEMQKRICLESASIAFLLTLIITTFFGRPQASRNRPPAVGKGRGFMMLLWACSYAVSAWRYR